MILANPPQLAFYDYAAAGIEPITSLGRDFRGWGMPLAPDESRLYFKEMMQPGADIKIARP